MVASWNVNTLTPPTLARLKERTRELAVDVWLLQEGRSLAFAYKPNEHKLAMGASWQVFSARSTAIVITHSDWKVEHEAHSDSSSLVRDQLPSGLRWTFVSLYLPVDDTARTRLLRETHTF